MVTNSNSFQKTLLPKKVTSAAEIIGVVISSTDGSLPNILNYQFILTELNSFKKGIIRQGNYCLTLSPEGIVVGFIDQIQANNEYFENAQTVKSFNSANVNLQDYIPSDQYECHIALVSVMGLIPTDKPFSKELEASLFARIDKVGFPVKPGNPVYPLEGDQLKSFLGLDSDGLNLGILKHHNLDTKFNINRLFTKHVAILAQSGAGKSYLVSVILEELLNRPKDITPAMLLIDVHGEYHFMAEKFDPQEIQKFHLDPNIVQLQKRIVHFNASFLQVGVPNMSEYDFQHIQPAISMPQLRELRKAIDQCRRQSAETGGYDLKDLIFALNDDANINAKVKETLVGWILDLDQLGIFAKNDSPQLRDLIRIGELTILDLSSLISMRKKEILLHYFLTRMFQARRNHTLPPFIVFLEEAHNFLPESGGSNCFAKSILETLAREGRKFFAQLVMISQRPVHLSTTALSQCNTQIIMRITNPYDLDHIKATSEALSKDSMRIITTLPTGNALVMGAALNYPVFIQVRQHKMPNIRGERSLTDICKEFAVKNAGMASVLAQQKNASLEILSGNLASTAEFDGTTDAEIESSPEEGDSTESLE